MRVKSVNREYDIDKNYGHIRNERLAIQFENNGHVWEKFFPLDANDLTYKRWFQSVIDDTLARV